MGFKKGTDCYDHVVWAMRTGIHGHPDWYKGLSPASSFEDFQSNLHKHGHHGCYGVPCHCEAPSPGSECDEHVKWGMSTGIAAHPDWYPGLARDASFFLV